MNKLNRWSISILFAIAGCILITFTAAVLVGWYTDCPGTAGIYVSCK